MEENKIEISSNSEDIVKSYLRGDMNEKMTSSRQKESIIIFEWIVVAVFWLLSLLLTVKSAGDLAEGTNTDGSSKLMTVYGIIAAGAGLCEVWKVYKGQASAGKVWRLAGIFILFNYQGVHIILRHVSRYIIWWNNIPIYYILVNPFFLTVAMAFLILALWKDKGKNPRENVSWTNLMVYVFLMLPLIMRIAGSFFIRNIYDYRNTGEIMGFCRLFLSPSMEGEAGLKLAGNMMSWLNNQFVWIEMGYSLFIYSAIIVVGIQLLRGRVTAEKYAALGGWFYVTQYGVLFIFQWFFNCIHPSHQFVTDSGNLIHRVLNPSYQSLYLAFLALEMFRWLIVKLWKKFGKEEKKEM